MNENMNPQNLKNHPPEQDAQHMIKTMHAGFSLPMPRKPLSNPPKTGRMRMGKGHTRHVGRAKHPQRGMSPSMDGGFFSDY